jgi:NAD-reducing hydrogenase large subunit
VSQIVIEPVTRIEGHAKITVFLDETGEVTDAHFHVTQVRGFERIAQGRPLHEMPSLMARICGICPVSHLIASAKACDEILGVAVPPVAVKLRRVINLAQIVQSHALSYFHLSSPDLLLGFSSDPAKRNLIGVVEAAPEMARDGIALRRFGQEIIEKLGGKRVHPAWVVPGGVSAALQEDQRDAILAMVPEAHGRAVRALEWYKANMARWADEVAVFANFPSMYMGLVHHNGNAAYSDGELRIVGSNGEMVLDRVDPRPYWEYFGEAVEPWTYLKFPYYKPLGYPGGVYRVGPLARLNVVDQLGSPAADAELAEFRAQLGRYPSSSFHYHWARLIEILHCVDMVEKILSDPEILGQDVRARAAINRREGVGVSEAPRGTLLHHYRVDKDGIVEWANLLIATGHNNLAMNQGVLQVARHHIKGDQVEEGLLNRLEAVIRTFDPCLSCSTHAVGQMPLQVEIMAPGGEVVRRLGRAGA